MFIKKENIISKIPGEPTKLLKENQGYLENISKLSDLELKDAIARQAKLLNKTSFIRNLPDRGKKIKQFKDKLEDELNHRNIVKQTSDLLTNLKIDDPNKLEWPEKIEENEDALDSDDLSDEETNPLKLIASQGGPNKHEKHIRNEKKDIPLITEEDIIESEDIMKDKHIKMVCEFAEEGTSHIKDRFKPFKTLNKEIIVKKRDHHSIKWENTAATPPKPIYGQITIINLQESLKLEKEHTLRLKKLQEEYARARLAEKMHIKIPETNFKTDPALFQKYRDDKDSDSDNEYGDEPLENDEEEPERDEATIYNLID